MKLLFCGATGYGNTGDDVIRDIYITFVNATFPEIEVMSTRPYPQKEMIEWADLVVIGGGGILYDWNEANFVYYSKYARYANELKKPYAFIGVGFQGFSNISSFPVLQFIIKRADFVSVRQQQDLDYLTKLHLVTQGKFFVGKDVGYLVKPSKVKFTLPSEKKKIAIIPGPEFSSKTAIMDKVKMVIMDTKEDVDFYAISTALEDNKSVEELTTIIGEEGSIRDYKNFIPQHLATILGEMDAVYTNRFHGIAFAAAGGCKKILGIGGRQKILDELPPENIVHRYSEGAFLDILNTCKDINYEQDTTHLRILTAFIRSHIDN